MTQELTLVATYVVDVVMRFVMVVIWAFTIVSEDSVGASDVNSSKENAIFFRFILKVPPRYSGLRPHTRHYDGYGRLEIDFTSRTILGKLLQFVKGT